MTPTRSRAEAERQLYLEAAAILVGAGIVSRAEMVSALLVHRARQPRPVWENDPPKYEVARSIALQIEYGEIDYSDGKRSVALSLVRGRFDHFLDALPDAAQLLTTAFERLDKLRQHIAGQLQHAIARSECVERHAVPEVSLNSDFAIRGASTGAVQ